MRELLNLEQAFKIEAAAKEDRLPAICFPAWINACLQSVMITPLIELSRGCQQDSVQISDSITDHLMAMAEMNPGVMPARTYTDGASSPAVALDMKPGQAVTIRVAARIHLDPGSYCVDDLVRCGEADPDGGGVQSFSDIFEFPSVLATCDSVVGFNGDGAFRFFGVSVFRLAFGAGSFKNS